MSDDRELAALLREGMSAEAREVSADARLAEQIITRALDAAAPAAGPRRALGNWALPVAAAALVALLVGSVLLGTRLLHPTGSRPGERPAAPATAPRTAATASTAPAPSSSLTRPSTTAPTGTVAGPAGGPVPAGFRAVDLTWISPEQGWALGTAPCATAPCTSIVRTSDGGRHWVGIPAPAGYLAGQQSCSGSCPEVGHLRFASALVGYAYGPNALFLTTDGGASWIAQPGGFGYALEVVAGSVLRVAATQPDCAPGCRFRLQRSAVGSTSWQDVALPGTPRSVAADLAVSGSTVVLASYANPAGGAGDASSMLFVSTDAGLSWRALGEPCASGPTGPGSGSEVDTRAVTVAPDGSITLLCSSRTAGGAQHTMTSTDGGRHFHGPAAGGLGSAAVQAFAASSATTLLASSDRLYRSTTGGQRWSAAGGPPSASYLGFESATVGRAIDGGDATRGAGSLVWTTTDGGASWTAQAFGG
jgi:hypothetical protein